ncbi:unnamed protein product [Cuscuta epithymum]|uniref:Uncharacterized protein n=1 Tax=Cuscuta epithymum TaxID=186058 RepID=A0AAV0GNF7_9ASTE|nr:unnamed protein product [Cuscuta epithymum]
MFIEIDRRQIILPDLKKWKNPVAPSSNTEQRFMRLRRSLEFHYLRRSAAQLPVAPPLLWSPLLLKESPGLDYNLCNSLICSVPGAQPRGLPLMAAQSSGKHRLPQNHCRCHG